MSPTKISAIVLTLVWALGAMAAPPAGQPTEDTGYIGELSGNNVYVRSGPSTNYYPVTKLRAGDRVRVIGQEDDWLAIVPPEGCYSLIADTYVDPGDGVHGVHGVVNGDNVRVRAGSLLQPNQYYASQAKLSKGAVVDILGHAGEFGVDRQGYYKIVPPAGVKLWISGQYVERVPEALLKLEAAGKEALLTTDSAAPATKPRTDAPGTAGPEGPGLAAVKARIKEYRARIEQLDADLKAELAKPLFRRDLQPIIGRFTPLANQNIDEFTAVYAATRIAQIGDMIETIEAVVRVRQLGEQVKTDRKAALTARANIRPTAPLIEEGFDAKGELRYSAIYDSPVGPQRFRLVDPGSAVPRTIGYVEVPADSDIDVTDYMGRFVGVRAREINLQAGGVDPIPIYTAAELVALETAPE